MSTPEYTIDTVTSIMASDLNDREKLNELLRLPSDVFNAARSYSMAAVEICEKAIYGA